jgi:hypothetical protein
MYCNVGKIRDIVCRTAECGTYIAQSNADCRHFYLVYKYLTKILVFIQKHQARRTRECHSMCNLMTYIGGKFQGN